MIYPHRLQKIGIFPYFKQVKITLEKHWKHYKGATRHIWIPARVRQSKTSSAVATFTPATTDALSLLPKFFTQTSFSYIIMSISTGQTIFLHKTIYRLTKYILFVATWQLAWGTQSMCLHSPTQSYIISLSLHYCYLKFSRYDTLMSARSAPGCDNLYNIAPHKEERRIISRGSKCLGSAADCVLCVCTHNKLSALAVFGIQVVLAWFL